MDLNHNMKEKLKDPKNIIILVLFIGMMMFASIALLSNSSEYKQKLQELQTKNQALQNERVEIQKRVATLESEYELLKKKEAALLADIAKRDTEITNLKATAGRSRAELDKLKKDLQKTRSEIENHEKNPANRTGNDLLNSLKLKTQ
jgi:septal ring factor EnvC (AmiA/AmiB activator)